MVVTVDEMVIVFCGAYDPAAPPAFLSVGLAIASACTLSFVEYCTVQPVPPTVPLMSNCTPM